MNKLSKIGSDWTNKRLILASVIMTISTVVSAAISMVLPIIQASYRTNTASTRFIGPLIIFFASLTFLAAICSMVLILKFLSHRKMHDSLNGILCEIEKTDSFIDTLDITGPCPVGPAMSQADKGWNKLLSAVDKLRDEFKLSHIESGLNVFHQGGDSARLINLLNALPDGVVLAEITGTIILANRACEGKIGKPIKEFVGGSIMDIFDHGDAQRHFEDLLAHRTHGCDTTFEVSIPHGNEDETILKIFCCHFGEDPSCSDIVLIIRDITQQVISQNSRDEFIAHVSHEFRSPLTNIRAYAETLLSDMVLDADAQKDAFNVINEETSRLTRLVNDVLDLSRLESGSLHLDKGQVVLDRLIKQSVGDVNATASGKKITLQTNYHPKLPNIYADREKLAIVLNNLLTNAIKYTPEGGTVFVETNTDEQFVYFKVTDTGFGIEHEYLEKIFEKFYRIERDEIAGIPGSGLGLATTKEIVTMHDGTITVSSEVNKGSTFLVKLPATQVSPVLGPTSD